MVVTATEFKTNVSRYIVMSEKQDIHITKNGKRVAMLVGTQNGKSSALHSLRGVLSGNTITRDSIREERLKKYDESVD